MCKNPNEHKTCHLNRLPLLYQVSNFKDFLSMLFSSATFNTLEDRKINTFIMNIVVFENLLDIIQTSYHTFLAHR